MRIELIYEAYKECLAKGKDCTLCIISAMHRYCAQLLISIFLVNL